MGVFLDFVRRPGTTRTEGIFLDFVRRPGTTRTEGPHGAYMRRAKRNRIDPHWGEIEQPTPCTMASVSNVKTISLYLGSEQRQQPKRQRVLALIGTGVAAWVAVVLSIMATDKMVASGLAKF